MKTLFTLILSFFIFLPSWSGKLAASYTEPGGTISGRLELDNNWSPVVYLSLIPGLDKMYTMSGSMIIAEAGMDSLGNFSFGRITPGMEESLLRLHVVKKGQPSTTLVIGGEEENHFFFIAHRDSLVYIQKIAEEGAVFSQILITGSPQTAKFNWITLVSSYPDMLYYDSTHLEKEFVQQMVNERLNYFADTCSNPILSLYAFYKGGFESAYPGEQERYISFLHKWGDNESSYFKAFRKQYPIEDRRNIWWILIPLLMLLAGSMASLYIFRNKKQDKLELLSVQERKVYEQLQEGATNQEIADKYHIGITTVKTHVSNIFSKLEIRSRKEIYNKPDRS